MAIARKIDPAALARSFADEISAAPEVKRAWYDVRPHSFDPDRLSLSFYVLLDSDSDAAFAVVADALTRLQDHYFDETSISAEIFLPCHVEEIGLDQLLLEGSSEIPFRGA